MMESRTPQMKDSNYAMTAKFLGLHFDEDHQTIHMSINSAQSGLKQADLFVKYKMNITSQKQLNEKIIAIVDKLDQYCYPPKLTAEQQLELDHFNKMFSD